MVFLFLPACSDDDPVTPAVSPWVEIDQPLNFTTSRFLAIDFQGNQGMALGSVASSQSPFGEENRIYGLQPDGSWRQLHLARIPDDVLFRDLALDPAGNPVLAGWQHSAPHSILLDFRGTDPEYFTRDTRGLHAVDGEGSFMVAGGYAQGGDLWTNTAVGAWNMDDVTPPMTGTNDSGFHDIYIRDNRVVACGFDDGADTLQVILEKTLTTPWKKVDTDGNGYRTFFCVALSENGTIYVGGIERAGGPEKKAFLAQHTADGLWTDMVLPDPEGIGGVNDILIAGDNTIYLACMGEDYQPQGTLIHAQPGKVWKEIGTFSGGLLQLAEADNGDIYAVGFRRHESNGGESAVMFKKSP